MPSNYGHILSDDVVVNYNGTDKDDCLHFLTHIDTTCKDLSLFISPTAKRIYTSFFNAWFLKMNFDVKHIDLQGFDTNKSYKITFKGNKYIYSFIDSKFTTGSVALLLHGAFGTYLYTGNFCYYPSFLKSPVLLPVIEEKALTRLYLDNTYYEQPSNFLGFNELTTKVADLIKSQPMKNFYIYADKVSMDPFIAEIASKLEERVYVCQSTMEIMKILGYESCFTRHSNESRIFIDKAFIKKRGFGLENIAIYINRYSESCKSFQSIDKKGNVYCFNFYCHSNNKEICELLRILKPESTTFLFSEIDKSKLSYNFKFKYDFPRNVLFKGISAKPSMKAEGETSKLVKNNHIEQLNATTTININDKRACVSKNFSNERIEVSVNQELNLVERTSVNQDVTNLSKNYICPLRIRKVPEINNVGLSHELNCSTEDSNNKVAENGTYNTEIIPYNSLKEINNTEIKTSNFNVQSLSESVLNHHKPQPNNSIEYLQSSNYDSARSTLFSSNIKLLSSSFVKTKTGMPLVFNPRLVKDNGLKGKKNSIFLNKQIDMNNTCVVTLPPKEIQRNKLKYVENRKTILTKKSLTLIKSKTADLNSNMKRPNALLQLPSDALNMTKLFHGWMDKNTVSLPNDSQTSEKRINGSEESILESQNCDQDIIELELPINNAHSNSDSSVDSVSLQPEDNINQPCGTSAIAPTEFEQHGIEQICNENNSGDHSTVTNLEKSVIDGMLSNGTTSILNKDSEVKQLNKSIEKNNENELEENNCQDIITKYTCNVTPKRRLSDDENRQSRKKLRSSHSRQQKNRTHSLRDCFVLVRRNGFERNYFYSSLNNCYLPKFCGFKKNEIRPRNMSITLRNLQKVLES